MMHKSKVSSTPAGLNASPRSSLWRAACSILAFALLPLLRTSLRQAGMPLHEHWRSVKLPCCLWLSFLELDQSHDESWDCIWPSLLHLLELEREASFFLH